MLLCYEATRFKADIYSGPFRTLIRPSGNFVRRVMAPFSIETDTSCVRNQNANDGRIAKEYSAN